MPASTTSDPDRLLGVDPTARAVARDLYESVADLPIISPHGHVPVEILAEDRPFTDAADLLLYGDHYVTRLLHASGVDLASVTRGTSEPREAWRTLCENWGVFEGTAVRHWIGSELTEVLGVAEPLQGASADATFDEIGHRLAQPEFRPRALLKSLGIQFLATTDDPLDDLAGHASFAAAGLSTRVAPTFRPDAYIDPQTAQWRDRVARILSATGRPTTFAGLIAALEERRAHFRSHGAVSADHGIREPFSLALEPAEAETLFSRAHAGTATAAELRGFAGHMLWQMARMSVEDGLVMTVHPGVLRNHHTDTFRRFGPDTGHDLPVPVSFVEGMRPILESFGTSRGFHLVLFTVDEAAYSREIAPLAGFYPSVFIGAPWWFLDAPDAILRFRAAVTETAGFTRGSGFIDDTRAFLSIPARHDTARRVDSAFLARLVVEGRVSLGAAHRIARELVVDLPRTVFKL